MDHLACWLKLKVPGKWLQAMIFMLAIAVETSVSRTEMPTRIAAQDSLAARRDNSQDANQILNELLWEPTSFVVTCPLLQIPDGRPLIRFPSPVPTGNPENDLVAMDWYVARDDQGKAQTAPAIIVVHESGSDMAVGRMFARCLQLNHIHAFMIHLPHYGQRRTKSGRRLDNLVSTVRQAVADVRRARDAAAVLPHVDSRQISVQGTSLGGFVVSLSGSLDGGFKHVFILLAGGNLHDVIAHGQKDTARLRQDLESAGYSGEKLKKLLWEIEPTRLAHRLDPNRTWLFSATKDQVVPFKNALLLARSASLDAEHHVRFPTNHYTGIVFLPSIVERIVRHTLEKPQAGGALQSSDTSQTPAATRFP